MASNQITSVYLKSSDRYKRSQKKKEENSTFQSGLMVYPEVLVQNLMVQSLV